MKKWKSRMFLGVLAITMALGLALYSPSPTYADQYTLAQLLGGQNVTIGDKIFKNWGNFSPVAHGSNAIPLNPASVDVFFTVVNPSLYRVDFQSALFFAGRASDQDTRFTFDVVTTTGLPLIEDNGLSLISFGIGDGTKGRITISEAVSDESGNIIGTKIVSDDHGDILNPASLQWDPPLSFIHIAKDIALVGDDVAGGQAFISDFDQTFSQIPEPTTLILLGSGLLGAALYRRLRKPKG
jgi:hypothetical protein